MSARDASGRFATKAREDLSPAYRRRLERAEAQGMSRPEARGHGSTPRRAWETASLVGQERYERSLQVVSRMRHGTSLSRAAKELGLAPDTVIRYAGSALARNHRGQWQAKPTDHLARRMRWLDSHGLTAVEPANSREARKLAEYWNAVNHYITTGDDRALRRFRRMRLRTRQKASLPFVTNLDQLDRLAYAGQLSFESIYEH
jgi:hypothetical protein